MNAWLLAAPIVSLLLLAAHFLREGAWPLVAACVALAGLLALRRPWVRRVGQAALALGVVEWLWTAVVLVQQRMAEGRPWGRLAAILAAVAIVTAASIVALERLRGFYTLNAARNPRGSPEP
jgi:hypothetical protein